MELLVTMPVIYLFIFHLELVVNTITHIRVVPVYCFRSLSVKLSKVSNTEEHLLLAFLKMCIFLHISSHV